MSSMSDQIPAAAAPHITIALCTFNGAEHLRAQLESYLAQRHTNWSLWVSDDGSSDKTLAILDLFVQRDAGAHPVRIIKGPQKGVAANFLSLLCHPDFPAGMTALSDQDDVWLPEKLEYAAAHLAQTSRSGLYGAQSVHVDNTLTSIGAAFTKGAIPDFTNALVQNIISGHSAVLTGGALDLVRRAGVPHGIPYHDWWLYLLVTGAGGTVITDDRATLLYRQHSENVMGGHTGWRATATRALQVLGTTYGAWLDANTAALQACEDLLTPAARTTLAAFDCRPRSPRMLARLGIRRQSRLSTLCVYLAAILHRI